jgi:vacuolar protein sorting-associated protein 13A/C
MASVIAPTGLQEKTQKLTYFQQLGAKIVDNIEVVLTNVHIRYEDSTSVPGRVFSFGITIDSISLSTTNENWNEAFVARDFNSAATATAAAIHKLGTLRNLGIYCKADNQPFADMLPSDWQQAMHDMIYTHAWETEGPPDTDFEFDRSSYILSVPNNLKVKLIHTERCTEDVPKVDVNIEVSNLGLNLDKQQFQQLMATSQKFSLLDKQKQVALLRPAQRPDKDPRGWWQYALKLITGRDMSARDKVGGRPQPHIVFYLTQLLPIKGVSNLNT